MTNKGFMIDAEFVDPVRTVKVYLVMVRYGPYYWCVASSWQTLGEAQKAVPCADMYPWKIVRVRGLPIEGEKK